MLREIRPAILVLVLLTLITGLAYPLAMTAIAGVIHYYWLVKADVRKPLQYAAVLALLLGYRLAIWSVLKFKANRAARLPRPRVQVSEG